MSTEVREIMTTAEAAAYLRCGKNTLEWDRCCNKHGFPYVRLGGRVRYRKADLDAFMAKNAVNTEGLRQ